MPFPISPAPASRTATASPASNSPATSTTPTGSRLVPPSRSARAAPASTVTVPCDGFAYFSHSLKLEWRATCARNRVPAGSPAPARTRAPPGSPLAITGRGRAAGQPVADHGRDPGSCRHLCRDHLRAHPAGPQRRHRMADLQVRDLVRVANLVDERRSRLRARVGGVEALRVDEEHEELRADQ